MNKVANFLKNPMKEDFWRSALGSLWPEIHNVIGDSAFLTIKKSVIEPVGVALLIYVCNSISDKLKQL